MITKYKIFENLDDSKKFWKVKINDLEAALYKINVPYEDIEFYLDIFEMKKNEYAYIAPFFGGYKYSWNHYDKYGFISFSKTNKLIYQGEIEITKQDIKDMKVKKNMQKYNL